MILFLSSLFSGILGGMGIGGGTILIPVLTFFTDYTQQQIQGINLIYFIPSAAMAVIIHLKKGNIEKKIIKPIVFSSVPAAASHAGLLARRLRRPPEQSLRQAPAELRRGPRPGAGSQSISARPSRRGCR